VSEGDEGDARLSLEEIAAAAAGVRPGVAGGDGPIRPKEQDTEYKRLMAEQGSSGEVEAAAGGEEGEVQGGGEIASGMEMPVDGAEGGRDTESDGAGATAGKTSGEVAEAAAAAPVATAEETAAAAAVAEAAAAEAASAEAAAAALLPVKVEGGSFRITTDAYAPEYIRPDLPAVDDAAFNGAEPWKVSMAARLMAQAPVMERLGRAKAGRRSLSVTNLVLNAPRAMVSALEATI